MPDFTTLKTYSALVAESDPGTTAANYGDIKGLNKQRNRSRLIELRLGGTPAVGGTANPTAVKLMIYRLNKTDATRDYLMTWTILATDITAGTVPPIIIETWGNDLAIRLTFDGGTAPTFTGTIQGRALE